MQKGKLTPLQTGFVTSPDSIQTSVYWYWLSDNISKEGVVKDLKAMKSVGINRAFIGNIAIEQTPYGKVKVFTNEWWDILHTALKTATELNIEIGIFNSPGWSQSGGPWIKPEQAMRYLTSSETMVTGGQLVNVQLPKPIKLFQDVKVIAFKAPKNYGNNLLDQKPAITTSVVFEGLNKLTDKDTATSVVIPMAKPFTIDFDATNEFTARGITIYPGKTKMLIEAELLVKENGIYRSVKKFTVDRRNLNLNVGFIPSAPATVSIPVTTSKNFRLLFSQSVPKLPAEISEIEISGSPKIENYAEKTLAKMYHSPLPYWNEYQWLPQPIVEDKNSVIDANSVTDISKLMLPDGTLQWNAPTGNWVVMRMGMTPTGVTNGPASPEATGLEVDKMSKQHVESHFNSFLGEIIKRVPAADRKTWRVTVEDSYETGGQNWT
ncbi:MAG: glycosyl hydrolase, partial [Sediminibacterium sp.]